MPCAYCGVSGHSREECLDRQEREIGTDRQLDDPLETCPDCGTTNNRSVNKSCWRCGHEFADQELVTDGGMEPGRRYVCTACDSIVRARWFGPGSFAVGCDCQTVPVVPQMGQHETPDKWRVERPECCRDAESKDLEMIYGDRGKDYRCPDCGAEYVWDGKMVGTPDSDDRAEPDDDQELITDGGTRTQQARLSVGDTRKPIVLKNARRVTTGDLSTLAMCAHHFDPADVMGWYTHEYDDVLREWICSNVGSVIARLSPHCEDTRGDLSPLHPSDDLWAGSVSDGPTQATLEDTEGSQ